jgi:hypothetical protein
VASPVLAPSCDGTVASACSGYGRRTKVDCARSGRACQAGSQSAVCVGTGVACAAAEKVTCVGSQASYCSGGARATVDCATNSPATRCADGASSEPCAVAGTACNPATFVDVCDRSGGGLDVCLDGTVVKVQCSDLGLVVCTSLNGESYARCQPGT